MSPISHESFSIFQFDHVSPIFKLFQWQLPFSNIGSCYTAAQSPGHPFLILSGHGCFCHSISFAVGFAFPILVFVSSALNKDRNFFIIGNTLLNCLLKNLCTGDIPEDFNGVLGNSSMVRQGLLLHFLIMYFICFTADFAIPLYFGIFGKLRFHLYLYLWAKFRTPHHLQLLLECHISWSVVSLSVWQCNLMIFFGVNWP